MKNKFSIAMSLAVVVAMSLTTLALADNVQNDVVAGGNGTMTAGGSTVINYRITANNGDGQTGCNAADSTPATVTINTPAGVTVDTSGNSGNQVTLTFTSCGTNQPATFTSNTPGDYVITVSVSDSGTGTYNTNPATFTLHVNAAANTAPSLVLPGNLTAEATSAVGAAVNYTATATDAEDNPDPTPTCSPASGSTFPLGTTTVNCSVTDSGGKSALGSFTVTVQDTTAPIIAPYADVTFEATSSAGAVGNYTGPATSDAVDGSGTATCTPASGGTFALGETTITCNATDAAGNAATATTFKVKVVDTTPPTVSAPTNVTTEATGPLGAAVSFTASASDLVDGAITPTCSQASGSTFPLGATSVTCSATDAAGNTGNKGFTVTVVDTTPPAVTVPGNMTVEATGPSGAAVTFTASASDLVDGAITPSCLPASGSTFPLGTTSVTCSATDSAGNTGSNSFSVSVVDTTPPAVTVPSNITAEATGPAGAVVTFSASANDLVSGAVSTTCSPASGSTFPLGTTTVNCSATDAAGNIGSGSFTVKVQDTTAPVLTLPSNMTVSATSAAGAVVTFSATASDLVDGSVAVTCTPASGSTFAPGTTTVNCSATDAAGNPASGSFTVSVKFQLLGFYQPVDMSGVWNTVKGGSTVPFKFELFAGSTELKLTSYVTGFSATAVTCPNGNATTDAIEVTATGATSLRFDTTADQFIYNWQTPKKPGACYKITMTAQDGSTLSANFILK